ncbi:tumor necrosis factor alpha-induced protein 8-like protein 1 isoform X2 [Harmonia axyridis]|nr:tumor necrosis factor alpha-induced protein 8-like protein 1 isoform X2 [Harmonia axyridis]
MSMIDLEAWVIYQCVCSECSDCLFIAESTTTFKAKDFSLRAQKKILSKMSGMTVSRVFIDDQTSTLLDHLYLLVKRYLNDKKESQRIVKNIIKTVIKFAILFRNDQFDESQKRIILRVKAKLKTLAMNIMTFYEMDFTYDRAFLSRSIRECHDGIVLVARAHLSPKSLTRINRVFDFFCQEDFLDQVFNASAYKPDLKLVVKDLNLAIDSQVLG